MTTTAARTTRDQKPQKTKNKNVARTDGQTSSLGIMIGRSLMVVANVTIHGCLVQIWMPYLFIVIFILRLLLEH